MKYWYYIFVYAFLSWNVYNPRKDLKQQVKERSCSINSLAKLKLSTKGTLGGIFLARLSLIPSTPREENDCCQGGPFAFSLGSVPYERYSSPLCRWYLISNLRFFFMELAFRGQVEKRAEDSLVSPQHSHPFLLEKYICAMMGIKGNW